ncbi:MAG TPA: FAD binding domain-containing protein [Acidiphilium sp.]|nr:MAG: molybdopterin dehydrogenase [Acidiphilium sp. 21-60-14]OYV91880.1 MAG: molybdopterin dehydrogenase [Acidiphilium sp. 37-60-79]HQT88006.1 FAD binding domain-containing protein [Acidiphilium sp.]HQU23078.1 FAD binding domain-containing protein [Acidiphilium sp.]
MKSAAFDYVRAGSVAEAIARLAADPFGTKLLAGGQSLLPALNLRLSAPALLVDIARLPELAGITLTGTTLRIGAGCTHASLLTAPEIARHAPLIAEALAHVAHPAIRSRGTLGGSLANADPAAELPAVMLALDATMIIEGPSGTRHIKATDFFTGMFETALAADEILIALEIPIRTQRSGFAELARRHGDYAIIGLAATMTADATRLAFFAGGPTAQLAQRAAGALGTGPLNHERIAAACTALAQDLPAHDDPEASASMRLHLARVLLRRVITPWINPSIRTPITA